MLELDDLNWKSKEFLGLVLRVGGKILMAIGLALLFISFSFDII